MVLAGIITTNQRPDKQGSPAENGPAEKEVDHGYHPNPPTSVAPCENCRRRVQDGHAQDEGNQHRHKPGRCVHNPVPIRRQHWTLQTTATYQERPHASNTSGPTSQKNLATEPLDAA